MAYSSRLPSRWPGLARYATAVACLRSGFCAFQALAPSSLRRLRSGVGSRGLPTPLLVQGAPAILMCASIDSEVTLVFSGVDTIARTTIYYNTPFSHSCNERQKAKIIVAPYKGEMKYMCLDFETNGFPTKNAPRSAWPLPFHSYPIQVSIHSVDGDTGVVEEVYSTLIKGATQLAPWTIKNTPIKLSDLVDGKPFREVLEDMAALIQCW